ncbi:hypothetical protein [Shewanella saliphila]|uniref:Cytochrome c assembly protein domain-containing protein n=1 Tax=Shewanella saliphila TaxID=2282698 RepID=A0ABQ2Q0G5_9GAMM|nr:hypothetical protein [Shewanella saliphila]MCL1100400.1 hypothetical protein [Shewanella saliphila]GGP37252.1 hypothetical protein GCM10009409_00100 [Shewanella saliphila]
MNDTSLRSIATAGKTRLSIRFINVALFGLAILILTLINANSLLFPASSEIVYLVATALVCLLSVVFLSLQNRAQINYVFILCAIALAMLMYSQMLTPPKDSSAMLTSIWAQLFFLSRPLALGLAIAGCLGYLIQAIRSEANLESHSHLLSLFAGTAYLGGEIAGSYWAFIGWGRSWSWSGHFFLSALTYLLFILVFHIPKAWFSNASALYMGKAVVLGFISLLMLGYRLL